MGRRYRYMFSAPNDVPLFGVVGVDRDANGDTTLYPFTDSSNPIHLHTCCGCMWIEPMILCFALLSFPSVNPNVNSSLVNTSQGELYNKVLLSCVHLQPLHYKTNTPVCMTRRWFISVRGKSCVMNVPNISRDRLTNPEDFDIWVIKFPIPPIVG